MLTAAKPFPANNIRELAQKHLNTPVPRLPESLGDYQALLDGMLAKDPSQRFQSAQQLLDSVDDVWTRLAVRAAQAP